METIFMTGATGVMGGAALREITERYPGRRVRLLVRDSKRNRRKMARYAAMGNIEIVWGDLLSTDDMRRALGDAHIVLHIGGMVSPQADHHPQQTMKVNVEGMRNLVEAVKARPDADSIGVVYIGSIAETSSRNEPLHWGRTGDPVMASYGDWYGLSKILAERLLIESGLKKWAVLRQSGILHPGLLLNGNDPISFHVPLRGVLEWATVEDSGRLMAAVCSPDVPEEFWRGFYNISSGAPFRLSNYGFESLLLKAIGCPPPQKVFRTDWFALRNFHGCWYLDADRLEELVPFRDHSEPESYFRHMAAGLPLYFKLAPLAPAFLIRAFMKRVALTPGLGTLDWRRRTDCEDKIHAFFGSREAIAAIPDWQHIDLSEPSQTPVMLSHGYDENKPETELTLADMQQAAQFRGGRCLSESMTPGDLDTPQEWECAYGHRFRMRPRSILKGGHWCSDCLPAPWHYEEEARRNPFLAQVVSISN